MSVTMTDNGLFVNYDEGFDDRFFAVTGLRSSMTTKLPSAEGRNCPHVRQPPRWFTGGGGSSVERILSALLAGQLRIRASAGLPGGAGGLHPS
jgi:hypothetical protein